MQKVEHNYIQPLVMESLKSSHDGFGIYDKNDVLIFCNEALARHFCLTPEQANGKTFSEMLTYLHDSYHGLAIAKDEIHDFVKKAHKLPTGTESFTYESNIFKGKHLLVSEVLASNGELFVYTSDITKLKQTEIALREALAKVEKQAATDSLTGISNRRHFFQEAEGIFSCQQNTPVEAGLLSIDIDHFKKINDSHGHIAGDHVLRAFTDACTELLRSNDIFGRLGGEEFSVILPKSSLNRSLKVAERIRKMIERLDIRFKNTKITITASIGVAHSSVQGACLQTMLAEADKQLYIAKNSGRNKIKYR